MKYAIISIDDSRAEVKERTRDILLPEWEEVIGIEYAHAGNLDKMFERYGYYEPWHNPKVGEIGVWYSNIAIWNYMVENDVPEMLILEDDAEISEGTTEKVETLIGYLPEDWHYLSLWIPPNQDKDYYWNVTKWNDGWAKEIRGQVQNPQSQFYVGNDFVARMYQGYGMIAVVYSLAGAKAALAKIAEDGIATTYDCYMASRARIKDNPINGYSIHPFVIPFVGHDFKRKSTIQQTERYRDN